MATEELRALAKARGLSVTEYLTAVYFYALYVNAPKPLRKPIVVDIPVSLRGKYPSETLRNFSLFTNVGFLPAQNKRYSFEDVAQELRGKIKEGTTRDKLQRLLNQNTALANSKALHFVPFALKKPLMRIGFQLLGQKSFTCTLTNLGSVNLPPSMQPHVAQTELVISCMPKKHHICALVSDQTETSIIFTMDHDETAIETSFLQTLAAHGANLSVTSEVDRIKTKLAI
jgi:hypothetical protein